MKYNPAKDLATGAMILSGTILVAVAAEISIPVLAIVGAAVAVGGGVYRVATLPGRNGSNIARPPSVTLPNPRGSEGDSVTTPRAMAGRY
jgi:hypothetical protein